MRFRLFIAVFPSAATRDALAERVHALRDRALPAALRFSAPEHWHLTLQFLGATEEERVPELSDACARLAAYGGGAFGYVLRGAGAFPSARRATTLFVAVDRGATHFARLAAESQRIFAELGFAPEARAFTPHLTLARSKLPLSLEPTIAAFADLALSDRASELALVRSHPGQSTRYEALARFRLSCTTDSSTPDSSRTEPDMPPERPDRSAWKGHSRS